MSRGEDYELANDKKYEKQVKEALNQVEKLTNIMQEKENNIIPEHYSFYHYFALRRKATLLEALYINGLVDEEEHKIREQQKEVEKKIGEIAKSKEGIEEKYKIAIKRIGKPGDPYGIGVITERVLDEINSQNRKGLKEDSERE